MSLAAESLGQINRHAAQSSLLPGLSSLVAGPLPGVDLRLGVCQKGSHQVPLFKERHCNSRASLVQGLIPHYFQSSFFQNPAVFPGFLMVFWKEGSLEEWKWKVPLKLVESAGPWNNSLCQNFLASWLPGFFTKGSSLPMRA